jgi:hypothetical protein
MFELRMSSSLLSAKPTVATQGYKASEEVAFRDLACFFWLWRGCIDGGEGMLTPIIVNGQNWLSHAESITLPA